MNAAKGVAILGIAAVLAQLVSPQSAAFHSAWYNVALIAVLAFVLQAARRGRAGALQTAGAALVLVAGLACGLLAPDPQTVIGAPGATVPVPDAGGALRFPVAPDRDGAIRAAFLRGGSERALGPGRAAFAGFEMWPVDRTVLYVDVRDARGAHVTITQPTGAAFLSPVLLLEAQTKIAGMNVPVDSFAVPAKGLVVKAVYFAPQQAAQLPAAGTSDKSAALFALSDENDRLLPHGLGIIRDGAAKTIGPLRLRVVVDRFPAVVVAAIPNLPLLAIGIAAFLAGTLPLKSLSRSKT